MPTPAPVYEPGAKLPTPGAPGGYVTAGANGTAPSLPAAPVYKPQAGMTPSTPSGQPALPPTTTPVTPPAGGTTGAGGAQNPTPASIVTPGSSTNNPAAPSSAQVQGATNTLGQSTSDIQNAELSAEDYAVSRSSDLIKDVSDTYSDELSAASQNAEGSEAAGGQGGGPVGASAEYTAMQPILNQQASAVATEIQNIQNNAASVFESAESDAQTDAEQTLANNQSAKTALLSSVSNMAAVGYTPSQLKEQNPDEYDYLLNYGFNGDENALNTAFLFGTKSTLLNSGQPVYTNGTEQVYGQMSMNPDGTPSIKYTTIKLPYSAPTGWVQNKISTTTMMMQDPNNPANTIIYTTDPLTGGVNVTGTGTGAALAAQYNSASSDGGGNTDSSSGSTATPPSGNLSSAMQNYVTTASTTAGVADPTQPFSTIVNGDGTAANPGIGIGAIVAGIPAAEGGSPAGVKNNTGNVLYVPGMTGATDSGVHPTNNPNATFASFDTKADGDAAIASTVQTIANNLGPNASLTDVLNTYVNGYGTAPTATDASQTSPGGTTTPANSGTQNNPFTGVNPTTNLSTHEYGALANVSDFNPKNATDTLAFNYLQTFFGSGSVPAGGRSAALYGATQEIQARARELYFEATGQQLLNAEELSGQLTNLQTNNTLLNTLKTQTGVIEQNFGLNLENMTENNINKAPPAINGIMDFLSQQAGSTSVAQYLSQNTTLSNEIGTLLSLKNASGTTVADKLAAQELNPSSLSLDQQKQILSTIMKEADNQQDSINQANATLYQQTDPGGFNPHNPVNAPGFNTAIGLGFTDNNNGTFTSQDGTKWTASANGFAPSGSISNPTSLAQSLGIPLTQIESDNPGVSPEEIITQYINQYGSN